MAKATTNKQNDVIWVQDTCLCNLGNATSNALKPYL